MNILNHVLGFSITFLPIFLIVYAHCRVVNVNMFNLIEVINSINKIRKEKRD